MSTAGRPSILVVGTVVPALAGQGSQMRFGMSIEALNQQFDVTLALALAVPGHAVPSIPEFFRRACRQIVVEGIGPGERSQRQRIESLPGTLPLFARMLVPGPMECTDYPDALIRRLAVGLEGQRFDALHVFRLRAAPVARAIAARLADIPPVRLLDLDDIESRATRRHAELHRGSLGRLAYLGTRVEAAKLALSERRMARWFQRLLVCSETDRQVLAARVGNARTGVLPNGIRMPERVVPAREGLGGTVLFVGSLDYPPNIDAVEFLLRDVVPALRRRWSLPLAIRIVGRRPGAQLYRWAQDAGAEVLADVPSVSEHYADADIVVAPIRTGGGTRIKILEAFAHERPVVSTTIGAEGLEVEPDQDLLIADDPDAFANACATLLTSTDHRRRLVAHAKNRVQETYSLEAIALRVGDLYGQGSGSASG
ncbi:MAG: glycosyltransferase family 4 protein [Burkholderiales bacterium]|nr:glycosyltransferase family 4 protein [Burkholderiales bacterium]